MACSNETGSRWGRLGLGVLFVGATAVCGFAFGAWLGARFFVPAGSGLAGPAIVLGYGLGGALLTACVAASVARQTPYRLLVGLALAFTPVAAILVGLAGRAYVQAQAEGQAALEEAYAQLPKFGFVLLNYGALGRGPLERIAYDAETNDLAVTEIGGRVCHAALSGPQKVDVLTGLRNLEIFLAGSPEPCAGRKPTHRFTFSIVEAKPPNTEIDLRFDAACLGANAAIRDAVGAAELAYVETRPTMKCE